MSNFEQVAIVLKCLPRVTADRFLAGLNPDDCHSLARLMERTEVTATKLQTAIEQLKHEGLGVVDSTLNHKTRYAPKHDAANPVKADSGRRATPFAFLKNYDPQMLLDIFSEEQPQDAATILATLPSAVSSAILSAIDTEKRLSIIRMMAKSKSVSTTKLMELKFALRLRIQKMIKSKAQSQPPLTAVETRADSIDELAATTRIDLPSMDKLAQLSDRQIKTLLAKIDTSHLAPALKGCPIQLQNRVLKNMAKKPAEILAREILEVRVDDKHRILRSSRNVSKAIENLKPGN